ncbi:MAG: hypothetical protein J0H14_08005 [Alphaproteobacteria bacterium]|nr:hypothetical protein [Alphaproteobacteria bacterium]
MINSGQEDPASDEAVQKIVASGALGAITLAAITTAIVIAIWLAFYYFVFLPRGTVP